MNVAADAPGKLVLLGEYAVLDGAPALVLAMPQRARVRLRALGGGPSRLRAPPLIAGSEPFRLHDGVLEWAAADEVRGQRLAWAKALIQALAVRGWWPAGAVEAELDSRDFHATGGDKLGLGASAALAVALTRAAARAAGIGDDEITLASLVHLHRSLQGDRGSGVDVAASLLGGTVRYRLDGSEPVARRVELPAGLRLLGLASGTAFSTASALARLRQWVAQRPEQWHELRTRLTATAEAGAGAANAASLVAAVAEFAAGLEALERASGIEILGRAHAVPKRLADEAGVAYKPSGAGGDLGIAASDDPGRIERLRQRAAASGLRTVPMDTTAAGADLRQPVVENE